MCVVNRFTGAAPCQGDSGGPLVYENQYHRHYVIGVASGILSPCGHALSTGLYTKVADFRNFILQVASGVCVKDILE